MDKKLSQREIEILYTLWDAQRPLMASEIANEEITLATVHTTLKRMLKKDLVRVVDFARNGNVFGRLFEPTITKKQYELEEFIKNFKRCKSKRITLSYATEILLKDLSYEEKLKEFDNIEQIIKEKREEIANRQ